MKNSPQYTMNIPDEIILLICTSLPAKSIGRFRCVSKLWNSLLSQPQFIKTHLNRIKNFPNEQHQSLIVLSEDSTSLFPTHLRNAHQVFDEMTTTAFPTKLTFEDHPFEIGNVICCMASCDGLILVQDMYEKLLLINPTMREIREVPPSPYVVEHPRRTTVYGLGYDLVSDDYKVVTVSSNETGSYNEHDCSDLYVDVYSMRKGTWKGAEHSLCDHVIDYGYSGVYAHGYIHWVATKTTNGLSVILAFDLAQEKFCQVPPPPSYVDDGLVVLGGCLCLFPLGVYASRVETDIWVMKEYGVRESWTKYTIFNTNCSRFTPLCMLGKEQVVLMKESRDTTLVVCNLEAGKLKDIVVRGIPDDFFVVGNCLDSLVSPHYTV